MEGKAQGREHLFIFTLVELCQEIEIKVEVPAMWRENLGGREEISHVLCKMSIRSSGLSWMYK